MAEGQQESSVAVASDSLASHVLFPGSEFWAKVPVPSVPSQKDISGLGVPSPAYIPGYVYWSRAEQGPKTYQQAYADKVAALILSVHPLESQDCKAPSPKELDGMRVRCSSPLARVLSLYASSTKSCAERFRRVGENVFATLCPSLPMRVSAHRSLSGIDL